MRSLARAAMIALAAVIGAPAAAHQETTPQAPVDCDGAPADAILQLPAPAGYWARIICTDTGHTLAPISGDAWQIHQDARLTSISAGDGVATGRHDWYFVTATVREVSGEDAAWAQRLFARRADFDVPGEVRHVHALDLTDNRGGMDRIYVFGDDDGPIAGVACIGSCATTVTVTVIHAEVAAPTE